MDQPLHHPGRPDAIVGVAALHRRDARAVPAGHAVPALDPRRLDPAVDVGPVIDAEARDGIQRHIDAMRARGRRVHAVAGLAEPSSRQVRSVLPDVAGGVGAWAGDVA